MKLFSTVQLTGEKETLVADLDHLKVDIDYKEEQLLKAKRESPPITACCS